MSPDRQIDDLTLRVFLALFVFECAFLVAWGWFA